MKFNFFCYNERCGSCILGNDHVPTNVLASVCYHTNPTDAECVSQSHQYLDQRYLSTMFVQKDHIHPFFVKLFLQIH